MMSEICTIFFFFSSRRRHTRSKRDWSSDVCSSDLLSEEGLHDPGEGRPQGDGFAMVDARPIRRLLAGEESVEPIEDAGPERGRAPEVEPRPRLQLPADGLGRARETAYPAGVARPAPVTVALDEVDAADLGVGLAVAFEVEDELVDVA